jgi:integrase
MRIEDIDFVRRRIRVRGKVGDRFVSFTTRVLHSLRRYIGGRRSGYLFVENRPSSRFFLFRLNQELGVAGGESLMKTAKSLDSGEASSSRVKI